jgi:hypothetical protein
MRFHVPYTECVGQAEAIWTVLRERLLDSGLPTTRRRIRGLSLDDRRPGWRLEIGDLTPDTGEPVLVILESSDLDLYFIFTPDHGILDGEPYPVALPDHGSAIEFEETAIERLWGKYLR